jgi:hypothetical protein
LNEKCELKYFVKQYSAPKGSIPIVQNPTNNVNNYRAHRLDKTNNGTIVVEFPTDFPFLLQCGNRLLYVCAESEKDRKAWVDVLRAHMLNSRDRDQLMKFIDDEVKKESTPCRKRLATRVSMNRTHGKTFTINNRVIDLDAKTEPFMQFLMHRSNFKVRSGEKSPVKKPTTPDTSKKRGTSFYFRFTKDTKQEEQEETSNENAEFFYVADDGEEEIRSEDGYSYVNDSLAAQTTRSLTKR